MIGLASNKSVIALVAGILAAALHPAEAIAPSVWAGRHLIVPDGPYAGRPLRLDLTPYVREPLDFFADDCADNKAVIRKSKQTGFTTMAIAAVGYTIDVEPCDLFLIEPTDSSMSEFVALKLAPAIEGSPPLAAKVLKQTPRSSKGSTATIKKFAGGKHSLLMAIATSSADLRGKTRKKVIRDEASEYPLDLNKQGSPHDMIGGAYETFLARGDWKDLWISTPVVKGDCVIDHEFAAGDRRFWHVTCPGCGEKFTFGHTRDQATGEYKPDLSKFVYAETYPYSAHYVAPCCGSVIEQHAKAELVRNGEWIATAAAPGRHRSYHFDALSSPFVPWDVIAKRAIEARDDPAKAKTFDNLTLGLAHEAKGDAPDYQKLLLRREDYPAGRIPARGFILVCGADVQHAGIWYEVVAFTSNRESWSIEHGFIEGDTTDHAAGAFAQLAELYDRKWPDAYRGYRQIDALGVDAGDGGRSNQVYAWVRSRSRAFALKGVAGWTAPAIGTPTQVDVTLAGRKIKHGAQLWPVGTWSLKSTFYSDLAREGVKAGADVDPAGYCHHHAGCDERYFKQQTAEYLKTSTFRGRTVRVWAESGPNHLLDCRVYAMAMAEYCGLTRMTSDQWAQLARLRATPAPLQEGDLFAPVPVQVAARPTMLDQPAAPAASPDAEPTKTAGKPADGFSFRRSF